MQCFSASKFELIKVNVRGSGAKGRAGRLRVLNLCHHLQPHKHLHEHNTRIMDIALAGIE
jgi:hypothetical protein